MSDLHVRQLESHIKGLYSGKIDLTDVANKKEDEKQTIELSRALALHGLSLLTRSGFISHF